MVHEYWNSKAKLFIVSFDILSEFLYLKRTAKSFFKRKEHLFLIRAYENVTMIYLNVKINSNYKELVYIKLCTRAITSSIVTESL